METEKLQLVAQLVQQRNEIDRELAGVIGRPLVSGHLGEWIASEVFDIALESSGTSPGFDGHFRSGQLADKSTLAGKKVNIKWYLAQQGILDTAPSTAVDYYLVLAGPRTPAASSRGAHRPLVIERVYLFSRKELSVHLDGRRMGVATSLRKQLWEAAEIYPTRYGPLALTPKQEKMLELFRVDGGESPVRMALRVLRAVHILHTRGYEGVRVQPGMSPSGLFWRVEVSAPGLGEDEKSEGAASVLWSTAAIEAGGYAGKGAEAIAESMSDELGLAREPFSDPEYAQWFRTLLERCEAVSGLPISYAEDMPPGWWIRTKDSGEPWVAPPTNQGSENY